MRKGSKGPKLYPKRTYALDTRGTKALLAFPNLRLLKMDFTVGAEIVCINTMQNLSKAQRGYMMLM
jgi:hypothetical protein